MNITISIEKYNDIVASRYKEGYDEGYANGWMAAELAFQENMRVRDEVEGASEFRRASFIMEDYHHSKGETT